MSMNLSQRIILNALSSSVARIGGSILALVSVGLVARALGPEGFGEYATVVAYLSTAGILADLGLYALMTREISRPGSREEEVVGYFFTLRLIVAVFFLALATLAAFLFPYSPHIQLGVVIAASGYLFLSLSQILMGIFQKYLQLQKAGLAELAGRAAQLALVWTFFSTGQGFYAYLWALVAGASVVFAINFYFARRLVPFRLRASLMYWKKVLRVAFPIGVSLVFTLLYFKIDTLLLSLLKPAEDVGIYNAAYKVLESIIFFPAMFVGIMLPLLSQAAAAGMGGFEKVFRRAFNVLAIFALPVMAGGILVSSTIIQFIGGSEFLASAAPLRVLFLAVAIIFFGTLAGNSVIALNIQKQAMMVYFFGMVLNVIANLIFIPKYSYMGAAWTTVVTEALVTFLIFVLIQKYKGVSPAAWVLLRLLPALGLMSLVVYYFAFPLGRPLSIPHFLMVVFLGSAVYGAGAVAFGAVSKENIQELLRIKKA